MRVSGTALRIAALAAVSVPVLLVLQGCGHREEGPLEKAGKAVDRTAGKVGDILNGK